MLEPEQDGHIDALIDVPYIRVSHADEKRGLTMDLLMGE
jgi:hypothetical protein